MAGKVENEVEKDRLGWSLVHRSRTLVVPENVPGAPRDVETKERNPRWGNASLRRVPLEDGTHGSN